MREAAARAQCQNNFKQIGLALHGYHDVTKKFPEVASRTTPPLPLNTNDIRDLNWGPTWVVHIMPHIELDNLRRAWRLDLPAKHAGNAGVVATTLQVFLCPSDSRTPNVANAGQLWQFPMARGNYGLNIGIGRARNNAVFNTSARRGIAHLRQLWAASMADVAVDGTSNTLAVGELITFNSTGDGTWGVWAYAGGATVSGSNDNPSTSTLLPNGDARIGTFKDWTPHCPNGLIDPIFTCEDSDAAHSVRSRHTNGANILLMDGSVRFVSNSVNAATWRALFSTGGGEVLSDF
ncbi:MAG: DUF1559 domain-containing protein [Gemmataceae bacterium]|nr:DUF1559 domain-containing protein [Gemmataceae bacterium]